MPNDWVDGAEHFVLAQGSCLRLRAGKWPLEVKIGADDRAMAVGAFARPEGRYAQPVADLARYLVAAGVACQGIDTLLLEQLGEGAMVRAQDRAFRQHEQLAAALRSLEWITSFCREHPEWFGSYDPASGAEAEWLVNAEGLLTEIEVSRQRRGDTSEDRKRASNVIYSRSEDGFWSNRDGWGVLSTATLFEPDKPPVSMPMSAGNDAELIGYATARLEVAPQRLSEMVFDESGALSLTARRMLFRLMWLLPQLGRAPLIDSLHVEVIGEGEVTFMLRDAGIGIDVGHMVTCPSISGPMKRPGYRLFTLEVRPGTRRTPPEEEDVTRVETLREEELLEHLGAWLAKESVQWLPPVPRELMPPEAVLEEV